MSTSKRPPLLSSTTDSEPTVEIAAPTRPPEEPAEATVRSPVEVRVFPPAPEEEITGAPIKAAATSADNTADLDNSSVTSGGSDEGGASDGASGGATDGATDRATDGAKEGASDGAKGGATGCASDGDAGSDCAVDDASGDGERLSQLQRPLPAAPATIWHIPKTRAD